MSIVSDLKGIINNPSVRSVGIYTFTNFFGKAISFLLLFVFTNPVYITPSENGLLSLFSTSILLLLPFLSLGIVHSTSSDFYKMPAQEFRNFFTTGFVLPLVIMLFSTAVLYLFRHQLEHYYGFPAMFTWLIPLICFLTFCNEQLLALARNNNEPGTYLKANMLKIFLELGISVVLVVFLAWRWQGRTTGILISYSILGLYAFYYFKSRGYMFGKVKKEFILSELVYAVPIIALQASIFAMGSSDKFFLAHFTNDNNETVGIYAVAATFASIIFVICTAFLQYLFPRIFSEMSQAVIDFKSIQKHFVVYVGVMVAGILAVFIFTPVAYHYFIHEGYHVGIRYVYLLCGGYFLWSVSYFFYAFLLYKKEKRKILALSACCIVISITLNYFFIRQWGAWGAAFASIVTYMLVLVLTLVFTRSYWKNFLILNANNQA